MLFKNRYFEIRKYVRHEGCSVSMSETTIPKHTCSVSTSETTLPKHTYSVRVSETTLISHA